MALNKEFFGTIKSKGKNGINLIKSKASEIDLSEIKRSGAEKGKRLKDKTSETTRAIKDKIDEKKDDSKILNADKWLNEAIENYNIAYSVLSNYGVELYTERERAVDSISNIEKLINSIANHPKSFDKDFSVIISQKENFEQIKSLLSVETLTIMQLLGFNYKRAIGEPLTLLVQKTIESKIPTDSKLNSQWALAMTNIALDEEATKRYYKLIGKKYEED